MPPIEFWKLSPAEADAFATNYWAAQPQRLDEFYARSKVTAALGTRESLVAAMAWAIKWWRRTGARRHGGDYPAWYLPPSDGKPSSQEFNAPAVRVADALGYLWLEYVTQQLPGMKRGRCDEQTLTYNKPVVWLVDDGIKGCPIDQGYRRLRDLRDDIPADAKRPAGRDAEVLAVSADNWVANRLKERASRRAAPPGGEATGALTGDAGVDAQLERLRLSWPLQTIYVDAERNAEAGPSEPSELNVVFDDVASHEFSDEIDALAGHLRSHEDVESADRHDREYILVELAPGVSVDALASAIDEMTTDFLLATLRYRLAAGSS